MNFKRLILLVLNSFFALVLLFSVSLLFLTVFFPLKNIQILKVLSGSMEPAIKVGSLILVKKVKVGRISVGDIITFHSQEEPGLLITHRVVGKEEKDGELWFSTKGDANDTADISRIKFDQIDGKVLFSLPLIGYVSAWISSLWGFLGLIVLPAVYIIVSEVFNIKNLVEAEIEKKYQNGGKKLLVFIFFFLAVGRIKPVNAYFSDIVVISGNIFSTNYWADSPCDYIWDDYNECFANLDFDRFQTAACVRSVMRELKTCMFRNRTNHCPTHPFDIPVNEADAICRFDFSFIDQMAEERLIQGLRFDLQPDNEAGGVILIVSGVRCGQEIEYQIDYSTAEGDRQISGQILDYGWVKKKLFLGTCSKDVCVADKIINNRVFLTIFVNGQEVVLQQPLFIN